MLALVELETLLSNAFIDEGFLGEISFFVLVDEVETTEVLLAGSRAEGALQGEDEDFGIDNGEDVAKFDLGGVEVPCSGTDLAVERLGKGLSSGTFTGRFPEPRCFLYLILLVSKSSIGSREVTVDALRRLPSYTPSLGSGEECMYFGTSWLARGVLSEEKSNSSFELSEFCFVCLPFFSSLPLEVLFSGLAASISNNQSAFESIAF